MSETSHVEAMERILARLKEIPGGDWEEIPPTGIGGLSLNGLENLHESILKVVREDDAIPAGQEKPYGARVFPDFKELSDQVEAELTRQQESFQKVPW